MVTLHEVRSLGPERFLVVPVDMRDAVILNLDVNHAGIPIHQRGIGSHGSHGGILPTQFQPGSGLDFFPDSALQAIETASGIGKHLRVGSLGHVRSLLIQTSRHLETRAGPMLLSIIDDVEAGLSSHPDAAVRIGLNHANQILTSHVGRLASDGIDANYGGSAAGPNDAVLGLS